MTRYVARRVVQGLFVLLGVTVLVFLLIHLIPGDPGRLALGERASAAQVERLNDDLGLNDGIVQQYGTYVSGMIRGDLGRSISARAPVTDQIGPRILPTFALVVYAFAISVCVAVPLALLTALHADRATDHAVRLLSVILYAIPSFWFGLMLALVFGVKLGWLPTFGFDGAFPVGLLNTLTLPALTLSFLICPVMLRLLRTSTIETLGAEFVEAAQARGLGRRRVLYRHVLRNSLTSSVTFLGASVGGVLSIAIVVEQVFAIPGLGSLLVSSVLERDYTTVQGVVLLFAVAVVIANLVADVMQAALDPRIRL